MDYQLARQIRGTSLKNLITGRVASGQGVGHALSMAVSDKFRAKAVGMKAKFDPLNIMKKMFFGSNLFTAVAGRAMGRSSRDIAYFTGINMRNRKYKDPKRNTVAPGRVSQVKVGDSGTDVLAKMFNFMVKTHEDEIKRYELEKEFRQEQKDEDERRHEQLLEAIINKKRVKEKPADEIKEPTKTSNVSTGMMTGLGGLLGILAKPFTLLFMSFKRIIGLIESIVSSVGGLLTTLTSLISNFASLVTGVIFPIIGSLFKKLFVDFILGNIARLGGSVLLNFAKNPLGATILAVLGVAAGASISDSIRRYEAENKMGEEGVKPYMEYRTQLDRLEQRKEEAKKPFGLKNPEDLADKIEPIPKQFGPERTNWVSSNMKYYDPDTGNLLPNWKKAKEEYFANLQKIEDEKKSATNKMSNFMRDNLKSFLIPQMEKRGFNYDREEIGEDGLPVFVFKNRLTGYESKSNDMTFSFIRDNETLANMLKPVIQKEQDFNLTPEIQKLKQDLEIGQQKVESLYNSIADKITNLENATIINQQTNVSKTTDAVDASPVSSRNQDDSLQRCLATGAVGC